ncbi:MAG: Crp/Fnr family transcriptional regulator [Aquificae bacterium]|nr:Crp/Fnr family transcriptional regulator [Aquificota bacterium]
MAINKVEFLRQLDLFKNFSDKELEEIAKYFHEKHYNKGDYLFFEEEAEPGIYILVDGLIKLMKETPDGKTIIVRLVFPKELFGWVEFGGKKPRYTYTAQAVLPSTVLYMSNQDFVNLSMKYPQLALMITCDLSEKLLETYEILKSIASGKVEERIAKLLIELGDKIGEETPEGYLVIEAPITRQDIAEMTGTTVETAIRIMSKWKKEGIIDAQRGRIVLKDLDYLEELAGY